MLPVESGWHTGITAVLEVSTFCPSPQYTGGQSLTPQVTTLLAHVTPDQVQAPLSEPWHTPEAMTVPEAVQGSVGHEVADAHAVTTAQSPVNTHAVAPQQHWRGRAVEKVVHWGGVLVPHVDVEEAAVQVN